MNTWWLSIPLVELLQLKRISNVSHADKGTAIRVIPAPHLDVDVNIHQIEKQRTNPLYPIQSGAPIQFTCDLTK